MSVCPAPLSRKLSCRRCGAMGRHEHVVDDHVDAAGGLQAGDLPGVDGLVIPSRHEKDAPSGGAPSAASTIAAEQCPVAMLAAAGIAPVSAETKAAVERGGLAGRHGGRADQHRGVVCPTPPARRDRRAAPGTRNHAEHAVGPGGRHVAFGERDLECRRRCRAPSHSRPSAWAAARGRNRQPASRRWSRAGCGASAVARASAWQASGSSRARAQ